MSETRSDQSDLSGLPPTTVMPAVQSDPPDSPPPGDRPPVRHPLMSGGWKQVYRRQRRGLHVAMRSPGAWILAGFVGVLTASFSPATTAFGGVGSVAGGGASVGGRGLQAVAGAGPDWAVLEAVAESGSPWLLVAVPALAWLVVVAVKP